MLLVITFLGCLVIETAAYSFDDNFGTSMTSLQLVLSGGRKECFLAIAKKT